MALRYWVGGSGSWSDTSHWAATSGGGGGLSVPTASDDVFIDTASSSGSFTIGGNLLRNAKSLSITTVNALQMSTYPSLTIAGSFTYNANVIFDTALVTPADTPYLQLNSNTATWSISELVPNQFNKTFIVSLNGTINISSNITLRGLGCYNGSRGNLNTNGYTINIISDRQPGSGVTFIPGANGMIDLGTSTINIQSTVLNPGGSGLSNIPGLYFYSGNGGLYYSANATINLQYVSGWPSIGVSGSATYKQINFEPGVIARFNAGQTTAVQDGFGLVGTSTLPIKLTSDIPGSRYTLSRSTGTVTANYANIQDSIATGGATFTATNSTDSGNNTGWTFIGPQIPGADFTYTPSSIYQSQSIAFTDTSSNTPTSWLWNFGDGTTSTLQNPTKQYTTSGTFTVSLKATNSVGSDTETKANIITVTLRTYSLIFASTGNENGDSNMVSESAFIPVESIEYGNSRAISLTSYQPLSQKDYEYRVYDKDNNFIAVWQDVQTQFSYDHSINQNAGELNVTIPRSPNNRSVGYDALQDNLGGVITDNNNTPILVSTETANAVGEGTDVDLNYNVEVIVFYGGYEPLLDEFSDPILDNMGEQILVSFGAPNGKTVYTGYIAEYNLRYGDSVGVDIVVVPHATEMSHYVYKNGLETTINYGSTTDPVLMARNAMDRYISDGGVVRYTSTSMPLSGEEAPYQFVLQTTREVVDKSVDLLPSGFYQYVDPADNIQYLLEKTINPSHTFYYEHHITSLELRKSITQLVNEVYFVGGNISPPDTTEVNLYKYTTDTTSISNYRPGLVRTADSRVTVDLSATILNQNKINEYKDPRYRTSVTISDGVYDIETIKLGQMVAFKNFGSFVDTLKLQIVTLRRRKHSVTLDLDMYIPGEAKRLEDIKKSLLSSDVGNIPDAPV